MIQNPPMTAKPSRPLYYVMSAWTLLAGLRLRSLLVVARLALGRRGPRLLRLRHSPLMFGVRDLMDVWTVKEVCLDRDYERAGVPIQPGWVILDVGAGIGEFAIDTARRHPGVTVHACEPAPETFALLCSNVRLNEATNVRAHEVAVTGRTGKVRLDVSSAHAARHHVVAGASLQATSAEVTSVTLADAMEEFGIATCDFLKMDCEGAEYAVLLGADRPTLDRIARICLEYHDGPWGTHRQLVDHLTGAGFRVTLTANPAYRELGFLYAWHPALAGC